MRLTIPMVLVVAGAAAGCTARTQCFGDEVQTEDGGCEVPVDDTDVDTDVDTDGDTDVTIPTLEFSLIKVEWTVAGLPNKNVVKLVCGTRTLLTEDLFTFYTTIEREFRVQPDQECKLTLTDAQGGLLPGGRLTVCSTEIASWEARRSDAYEAATFNATLCVEGCDDPIAENYNASANLNDGSCSYVLGCTDSRALNFNASATKNDGTCEFGGFGPVDVAVFTDDSPSDTRVRVVCDDAVALDMASGNNGIWAPWNAYTATAIVEGGYQCDVVVSDAVGDMGPAGAVENCGEIVASWDRTPARTNKYDVVVGSFFSDACSGCNDEAATNYDPTAQVSDGSCIY